MIRKPRPTPHIIITPAKYANWATQPRRQTHRLISCVVGLGMVFGWSHHSMSQGIAAPVNAGAPNPAASPANAAETQKKKADADPTQLENVVVAGGGGLVRSQNPEAQADAAALAEVPGGTSVVDSQDVDSGRAESIADVLKAQPGVFAQEAGGNDAIKISIRGSGINRGTGFFRSGIKFTYDGLPITTPSGTPFELFEPLGLQYTEVLRGGNAFDRGALALGGAINYVTNTGYQAAPIQARFEAGSFGYYKGQVSSGLVEGPFDYYLSLTSSTRLGYQNHSNSDSDRVAFNVGYKITPDLDTRFYFRFGYTAFDNPGVLTRRQIYENPTQANAANLLYNSYRIQPGSELIGNNTTYNIDKDSSLNLGVAFQNFPIRIEGGTAPSAWDYGNIAAQLKYTRADQLFDRTSTSTFAAYSSTDIYGNVNRFAGVPGAHNYAVPAAAPLILTPGELITTNEFHGSSDNVLLATNDTEVIHDLWLTTGIAGTAIRRHIDITYPVSDVYDKTRFNYEPRLGLRYDITPTFEVFANGTRSVEPRNDWASVNTPQTAPGYFVRHLHEQTAWTGEVGVRAKYGIFEGSADYYYSAVRHELLTVVVDQTAGIATETNASPTTHQGVEVALDTLLWHSGGRAASGSSAKDAKGGGEDTSAATPLEEPRQRLVLHQSFTYSDFYYNDDRALSDNRLPGIPEYYYQAVLRYDHPSGFYASFDAQAASSYFIDYANTFTTDGYVIFGATVGYLEPKKQRWEAYVDFRNLTGKHYAADISPTYNAHGKDVAVSDPGDGFGVFGGLSFSY